MIRGRRRRLASTLSSLPRASPSDMFCEAVTPPVPFAIATRRLSPCIQCRYSLVPLEYAGNHVIGTRFRHMSSQAGGRKDPTAKRPTRVCDPYGQSGKPLSKLDAQGLMATLEDGWILEEAMSQQYHGGIASDDDSKDAREKQSATATTPSSIYREYYHDNFMDGSRFVAQVAAVAHNNNHYPCITLERRLMKREKAWRVVSVVKCFTPTLGGLSYNDFHLAMLVDVETARPEVAALILDGEASLKKHT